MHTHSHRRTRRRRYRMIRGDTSPLRVITSHSRRAGSEGQNRSRRAIGNQGCAAARLGTYTHPRIFALAPSGRTGYHGGRRSETNRMTAKKGRDRRVAASRRSAAESWGWPHRSTHRTIPKSCGLEAAARRHTRLRTEIWRCFQNPLFCLCLSPPAGPQLRLFETLTRHFEYAIATRFADRTPDSECVPGP